MIKTKMLAATAAAGLLAASGAMAQTAAPAPAAGPAQGASAATPAGGSTSPTAGATSSTATLAAGTTVYDQQGGTVGKIESVQGDFAVLATAKSKVKLPKSSFGSNDKGPVLAMTAAQLDQAAAQAAPQASASGSTAASTPAKANVAKGAEVADTQGGKVGTVSAVDTQFATVDLATGGKVRLPVTAFGAGDNGGLRIAMTAAQLSAAAGAGGSAKSSGGE